LKVMASAPGRADLLNTHQDYKGLPVVSAAIALRTRIYAEINDGATFKITSEALAQTDEFPTPKVGERAQLKGGGWFGDYLRAVAQVLLQPKLHDERLGLAGRIISDVPQSSGLASSAALEVAFASLLNRAYGLGLNRRDIAELAYKAEREVMGIPCGRLDQYGSALGGISIIGNRPPYPTETLGNQNLNLIVIDSGIKHSTASIHPVRQSEMQAAVRELAQAGLKLPERFDEVRWEDLTEEQLDQYLPSVSEVSRKRVLFTIRMQRSTEIAISALKGGQFPEKPPGLDFDPKEDKISILGKVMDYQHELLRDYYDVSLTELEKMRVAAESEGAIGVKISGSGMGGSLVGLLPREVNGENVVRAAIAAGARSAWSVRVGGGEISKSSAR